MVINLICLIVGCILVGMLLVVGTLAAKSSEMRELFRHAFAKSPPYNPIYTIPDAIPDIRTTEEEDIAHFKKLLFEPLNFPKLVKSKPLVKFDSLGYATNINAIFEGSNEEEIAVNVLAPVRDKQWRCLWYGEMVLRRGKLGETPWYTFVLTPYSVERPLDFNMKLMHPEGPIYDA